MEFTNLNLLIHQIALKSTTKSIGVDGNYQHIAPISPIEFREMGGFHQSTAPKPTTSKGPSNEEFMSQISHMLKEEITKAVTELKKKAQEFIKIQAANNEVVRVTPLSYTESKGSDPNVPFTKKRQKTILVGEIQKSFKIPDECALYILEADKLPILPHLQEKLKPGIEQIIGLKFFERLVGWNIRCRQRDDGKLDMYFHHVRSNEPFRSIKEVANFVLYEICPRHLEKSPSASNKNVPGSNQEGETEAKVPQRSSISPNSGGINIERKGKCVQDYFKTTSKNFVDGNSSQSFKTKSDEQMNDTKGSTSSNKPMIENSFLLEYKEEGKRKRTEDSPSMSSKKLEKCIASSPDLGTSPSVDVAFNAIVEVQEKMVEPDAIPEPVNSTVNPTEDESGLGATSSNLCYPNADTVHQ